MGRALYTVGIVLLAVWLIGFFAFNVGGIFHVLPVASLIIMFFQLIRDIAIEPHTNVTN